MKRALLLILLFAGTANAVEYDYWVSPTPTYSDAPLNGADPSTVQVQQRTDAGDTGVFQDVTVYTPEHGLSTNAFGDKIETFTYNYGTTKWLSFATVDGVRKQVLYLCPYNCQGNWVSRINDNRLVIGNWRMVGGYGYGFIYDGLTGQMTDVQPSVYQFTAKDINNSGQIVGFDDVKPPLQSTHKRVGFMIDGGAVSELRVPGALNQTQPIHIADDGTVYGYYDGYYYFVATPRVTEPAPEPAPELCVYDATLFADDPACVEPPPAEEPPPAPPPVELTPEEQCELDGGNWSNRRQRCYFRR